MPKSLKSNFEIFILKWLPQRKDVKNLELWILISWNGITVDYLDFNFSNASNDSYAWSKFHFLCQNPFKKTEENFWHFLWRIVLRNPSISLESLWNPTSNLAWRFSDKFMFHPYKNFSVSKLSSFGVDIQK